MKKLFSLILVLGLFFGGVAGAEDRLYLNCKFVEGIRITEGKVKEFSPGSFPEQNIELDIKNKKIISAIGYDPDISNFFESWSDSEIRWGINRMIIDKKTKKLVLNNLYRELTLNRYTGDFTINSGPFNTLNYKCLIKKKIF